MPDNSQFGPYASGYGLGGETPWSSTFAPSYESTGFTPSTGTDWASIGLAIAGSMGNGKSQQQGPSAPAGSNGESVYNRVLAQRLAESKATGPTGRFGGRY